MWTVDVRDARIPALGFGTWELSGQGCYEAVRHALELGYRHLDTAQMYGNEEQVGRAIADSDVDRDDLFLTTKIPPRNLRPDDVRRSHEDSLRALGTDRVDLLLIHWPSQDVPLADTLGAMRELQERGQTRHLGVSNFPPSLLREACEHADIVTDQVEFHPYLDQPDLVEVAGELDVSITAYSPLAKGRVVEDDTLREIAKAHDRTAAQVSLRWLIQQPNVVTIPRSSSADHRAANWDIWDFELSDDEMQRIHDITNDQRLIDPPFAPDWER